MNSEPLAVDVATAAQLIGMGRTWTWQAVRSGELPSVRIGRRVLITREALANFVRGLEQQPAS